MSVDDMLVQGAMASAATGETKFSRNVPSFSTTGIHTFRQYICDLDNTCECNLVKVKYTETGKQNHQECDPWKQTFF